MCSKFANVTPALSTQWSFLICVQLTFMLLLCYVYLKGDFSPFCPTLTVLLSLNCLPNQLTSFDGHRDTESVKVGWTLIGGNRVKSNLNFNCDKITKKDMMKIVQILIKTWKLIHISVRVNICILQLKILFFSH